MHGIVIVGETSQSADQHTYNITNRQISIEQLTYIIIPSGCINIMKEWNLINSWSSLRSYPLNKVRDINAHNTVILCSFHPT